MFLSFALIWHTKISYDKRISQEIFSGNLAVGDMYFKVFSNLSKRIFSIIKITADIQMV